MVLVLVTHDTIAVARFADFFFRMTGLHNPKSSKIEGILFFMVIVAYLGAMGFFVRSSSLFVSSKSVFRRGLKAPKLSKTPEKKWCTPPLS